MAGKFESAGRFQKDILDYIQEKYPHLLPLYDTIYNKGDRGYFRGLEEQAEHLARECGCPFVDNELPYGRAEPGHPVIVDYFTTRKYAALRTPGSELKSMILGCSET